jgi:enamine deaminase RidA (YjgF/YER057c/UK114 family)
MSTASDSFNYNVPWENAYGYSQALRVGETIYISGQLAHNEEGTFVGAGDFAVQMKTALENLDKVLAHFGATRRQVVETTVLIVGLRENFDAAAAAHANFFADHHPTSTASGVVALALPEQLVEIGAVVRLDLPS